MDNEMKKAHYFGDVGRLIEANAKYLEACAGGYPGAMLQTSQDLIYAQGCVLSAKTAEIEKLRMEIRNRDSKSAAATGNNNFLSCIKGLRQPLRVTGATSVKVNGKPKTVCDTSRVNYGEQLSGTNIEHANGGHKVDPRKDISLDHLTTTLCEIEKEVISEIVSDTNFLRERMPEEALILAWEKCRGDMLFKVMTMIRTALK